MPRPATQLRRCLLTVILFFLSISGSAAEAGIIVFDTVTPPSRPVYIKVLTKGRLFPAGGQRVRIEQDDHVLGHILTGGDGYGFLKVDFHTPGAHEVTAESNGDRATGTVLVVPPERPLILIEIQGVSLTGTFFEMLPEEARDVLVELSKSYELIYLAGGFGVQGAKRLIRTRRFPPSVVILYRGRKTFRWLKGKGLHLHAAVGSSEFSDAAEGMVQRRFSIQGKTTTETIENWNALPARLK